MKAFLFLFLLGFLKLLSILPYKLVAKAGACLGGLLFMVPSRRRHIVLVNLKLCFPLASESALQCIARGHFKHVVRSYLERGFQWFGNAHKIQSLVQVDSAIDLYAPNAPPTIFMGFHFVGIEVGCMKYSTNRPVAALYTRMSNPRLCDLAKRQRGRFGAHMIERGASAKEVIKILRKGTPVMLAADMDHGEVGSVYAPFFGVQACTLTAISRMAKISGARVIPFVTEVLPEYEGYKMTIFAPLANYPSESEAVDARTMNAFLETQIERLPEQYYWVHRRFKHRPVGVAGVY